MISLDEQIAYMKGEVEQLDIFPTSFTTECDIRKAILKSLESLTVREEEDE